MLALGAEVSCHSISTFNMGEPAVTPTIAVSLPPVVVARIRSFLLLQQILNEVGQLDILIFFSQSNKAEELVIVQRQEFLLELREPYILRIKVFRIKPLAFSFRVRILPPSCLGSLRKPIR